MYSGGADAWSGARPPGPRGATGGTDPREAGEPRMRRPLLAFLISFAVVATSGVTLALWVNAMGGFELGGFLSELRSLGSFALACGVFSIEAIVVASIVARRRHDREWLAAYVGVVLGVAPFFALAAVFQNASCSETGYYWLESFCFSAIASCPSTLVACPDVLGPTVRALLMSALAAGLIFFVARRWTYHRTGTTAGGPSPQTTGPDASPSDDPASGPHLPASPHAPAPDLGTSRPPSKGQ